MNNLNTDMHMWCIKFILKYFMFIIINEEVVVVMIVW
jgi:hypothetical protein